VTRTRIPDRYRRPTPLWLSHHHPDQHDRCARVGRHRVCRRCLWFYPACFATAWLSLAGVHWPASWDPWLLWLLPVPVVAEWWGEHLGRLRYSARRQVALSLLAAPAVGRGLGRYLPHPGDRLFWAVVVAYAVVCLIPVLVGRSAGPGDAGQLEGVGELLVAGDDPHGDAPTPGDLEGQLGPVGQVAVDDVAVR
jgi:hypothetical protein